MKENQEKRKRKRIAEVYKVTLEVASEDIEGKLTDENNLSCSLTQDISLNGVKILSNKSMPHDKVLKLDISLGENKTISILGKVKWNRRVKGGNMFENGLEFVDTRPNVIMTLISHIYQKKTPSRLLEE